LNNSLGSVAHLYFYSEIKSAKFGYNLSTKFAFDSLSFETEQRIGNLLRHYSGSVDDFYVLPNLVQFGPPNSENKLLLNMFYAGWT